ncbi:hypothetical protein PPMP20_18160 [Paraburkholderia phymatum]|uniref:Uncharacterized protein n=1 Tax=Paraburkholderia phymatum (strain DSM 17167 / CIP 108236 / LMG 21445 / STM815) TaxID=391038 RepID=B2JTU3_PARP8|nr:hypothetical protein [Paraburkholderia phymatum]ACC75996.1 hypothetical protein Bphy_6990 [Paraburkholderia phymatum STM815]
MEAAKLGTAHCHLPIRSRPDIAPARLAVAFVVGSAFSFGVVLPWMQVAASNQQLYSRDTLAHDAHVDHVPAAHRVRRQAEGLRNDR